MKKLPVILVLTTACGLIFAQSPTLRDLEKQEQAQQTLRQMDDISATLQKIEQDFQLACAKAFGSRPTCKCIGDNIPAIFSFVDYVKITTQSKAENNYAALDKQTQQAYEKVATVRDMCIAKAK